MDAQTKRKSRINSLACAACVARNRFPSAGQSFCSFALRCVRAFSVSVVFFVVFVVVERESSESAYSFAGSLVSVVVEPKLKLVRVEAGR